MSVKYPIYLDHNSSTPLAPEVLERMLVVLKEHYGNPSSATHVQGWYAEELVQIAREQVAEAIGASSKEIFFVSGATEANNLLLQGLAANVNHSAGPQRIRVLTAATEHKSVLEPLEQVAESVFLPLNREGLVCQESAERALRQNVSLMALMLANNEIGSIQPLAELSRLCRKENVLLFSDATQGLGKLPIDVKALGVDYLSLSAHKCYGPKGIGALYIREGAPAPRPLFYGGKQEGGLRAGTLNVPGIVGLGQACVLAKQELARDRLQINALTETLLKGLKEAFPGLVLNGPPLGPQRLAGNLNCSFPGRSSGSLLSAVQAKVSLSTGSACQSRTARPSHVLEALGLSKAEANSALRFGIGRYNTAEEIAEVISIFKLALAIP